MIGRLLRSVRLQSYIVFRWPADRTPRMPTLPDGVTVREVGVEHLDAIGAYAGLPARRLFETYLKSGDHRGWCALRQEVPVAHAWLTQPATGVVASGGYLRLESGQQLIHHCRVSAASQGQGLFALLISWIVTHADHSKVLIDTESTNEASLRSIQRAGFTPESTLRVLWLAGRPIPWRRRPAT